MIFNELFKIWNRSDLLTQSTSDSREMLEVAYKMFDIVTNMVMSGNNKNELEEVHRMDYLLNHFERSIRKKVFEHLTVNDKEEQHLYSAVLLVIIVSNIERLGDYCKNIAEIAELRENMVIEDLNLTVKSYIKTVRKMFKQTISSYKGSDVQTAGRVNLAYDDFKKEADSLITDLATRERKNNENYVVYVLFARYMKRIGSHLMHLTSSITNPLDRIGYRPESKLEEE